MFAESFNKIVDVKFEIIFFDSRRESIFLCIGVCTTTDVYSCVLTLVHFMSRLWTAVSCPREIAQSRRAVCFSTVSYARKYVFQEGKKKKNFFHHVESEKIS